MGAVVGNLGLFMQMAAYAMAYKVPDHGVPAGTHKALHSRADVRQQRAGPHQFNGTEQGFLRHGQQAQLFRVHHAHGHGHGVVSMPAVHNGAHVQAHDVPVLDAARTAAAVHHFLIDGNAELAGEPAVLVEGVAYLVLLEDFTRDVVYFPRGAARLDLGSDLHQDFRRYSSGLLHLGNLAGRLDVDSFCHGIRLSIAGILPACGPGRGKPRQVPVPRLPSF